MVVFRKNNEIKICRNDRLNLSEAREEFNLDLTWEAGYCKTYIDEYFDIVNNQVIFWDTQKRYDNGVLEIHPFNKVVNGVHVLKTDSELISEGLKTLSEVKAERLTYWSDYSQEQRRKTYPDYKMWNAALDIYDANEKANIKKKCTDCRNEYYRIKAIIDAATNITQIDNITWGIS